MRWIEGIFCRLFPIHWVVDKVEPYLDLQTADRLDPRAVSLHRRILKCGLITGLATSAAWTIMLLAVAVEAVHDSVEDASTLFVLLPFVSIAVFVPGTLGGVAGAIATTPWSFLSGPGRQWIRFVGTKKKPAVQLISFASALFWSPILVFPLLAIIVSIVHS